MLTKREQGLPGYDKSFLKDPIGLMDAELELASEDLIYLLKRPKIKNYKKYLKETIKRIEKAIEKKWQISCAIENAKLKIARKLLKEKNG